MTQTLARVRIDVEEWEVAARDVDANAMAFDEAIGDTEQVDGELVNLPGLQELCFIEAVAKARALDAVGDEEIVSLGVVFARWMYIDELGGEIGILR